ncbi:hypothetical protein [Arthrobacter sp. DR-2P]|nr:hypothetical protein [Arthrobacter sp. DR-2P]
MCRCRRPSSHRNRWRGTQASPAVGRPGPPVPAAAIAAVPTTERQIAAL